ncbi:hypothetical protein K504DRAFT_375066 [Pleomassaria siparia CBS 279.74]|uniref:Uncharacterized protein n=1 Tax=Pleomassaria siparia CBS 279.74 TaxID=1314801 RepID=A0A6G1KGE3_9PLEO|nr:hypothetical protein K504DRAFT_375066 [Pleomassaria siparia CBS 279.74]
MTPTHSRNPSQETNASVSYNMILEHVLQYPGSYEIPLRTMYTLNCAPRAQPLPKDMTRASSPAPNSSTSPVSGQFAWSEAESATMNFTTQLMGHLGSLPSQPSSLPPAFIISFASRCFHPCLPLVDFPQALTALDYLRDLETRRRKEVAAAYQRLSIHKDSFTADVDAVSERFPGVALWAKNIQGKSKKAELYYSQLWLGLRRWIMINELSLEPFNKLNCVGMLNTLLPPQPPQGGAKLPAPYLTHEILKEEREGFFDYIQLVQKNGPVVLKRVMDMNKGPEDENGWPSVQQNVDKYLRVAKNLIDDCMSTTGTEDFTAVEETRKGKKTDSGVSFGSERRPNATPSTEEKPLPVSPPEFKSTVKGMSTLERITREFRRMRVKTRPDVEEIVKINKRPSIADLAVPGEEPKSKDKKSIKKARSLIDLGNLRGAHASSTSLSGSRKNSQVAPFDADEMKRHRKMYETLTVKEHNR